MKISIINLGSQYTHVIWRTMRDIGVEAVIQEPGAAAADVDFFDAYIISGGPSSANELKQGAAHRILELTKNKEINKPILGICLGHQLMTHILGGEIGKGKSAEYGVSEIEVDKEGILFKGLPKKFKAWVSHFDEVKKMPDGFESLAHSSTCQVEAMQHKELPLFSTQFHPEVWHTENGDKILENYAESVRARLKD